MPRTQNICFLHLLKQPLPGALDTYSYFIDIAVIPAAGNRPGGGVGATSYYR